MSIVTPGSDMLNAPGRLTRLEPEGTAVPVPVTVSWAHSG